MEKIFLHNLHAHSIGFIQLIYQLPLPFDYTIAADNTRRALVVFYRSRWTRNYSSKYIKRASILLHQAAELGNISAMNFLGLLYGDGWGVAKDYTQAVFWLQKAAAARHPLAIYNLAVAYDNGLGVDKSHYKAFQLFLEAANLSYVVAMHPLGSMYEQGTGTEKNYVRARYWYKKAAIAGHTVATYDLGRCYMRGIGGPVRMPAAKRWLEAAQTAGEVMATVALGNYFTLLSPPNWKQALTWYERAVEQGPQQESARALYQLGKAALLGQHIPGRSTEAKEYFQWAAKFGHPRAAIELALLTGESF
ncbi:tetratricopeptide repeat protein [Hymenobacter amundsenii]|uniref:tetratricopeptide repeat protein n=1 Tax=Hymenobacter amundsenii TaxID=2006685 RepID=UPI0013FD6E02|nr:tetratricopeptide repeat protein [Hymenobacter amundsenii]